MKLYRYRNCKRALEEIEKGTFYFASREELNDPIEGYVKLYFQGDQPAWEGLLRNYVCSLFVCIYRYLVMSPSIDYEHDSFEKILKNIQPHSVIIDIHSFDDVSMGKILNKLGEDFLNIDSVQKFVNIYGNNALKCPSKELRLILRTVHHIAFNLCLQHFKARDILRDFPEMKSPGDFPFEIVQNMGKSEWANWANEAEDIIADMMEQLTFITKLQQVNFFANDSGYYNHRQHMTWANIQVNFPKFYVSQLQDIIYPNAYVVCFSEEPTNSAMWGNYAQNHQGICFIYETQTCNGQNVIEVGSRKMQVRRVTYDKKVIEKNFFTTWGRVTLRQIQSWLTGKNGSRSELLDKFSDQNIDSWRDQYWDDYIEKFHRKHSAWDHEKEYRIFLHDIFSQYDQNENRCLKYGPSSLKGVIFGINTSVDDKFNIFRAIHAKADKFSDVKFFQSEYKEDTQEIIIREKIYPE